MIDRILGRENAIQKFKEAFQKAEVKGIGQWSGCTMYVQNYVPEDEIWFFSGNHLVRVVKILREDDNG